MVHGLKYLRVGLRCQARVVCERLNHDAGGMGGASSCGKKTMARPRLHVVH